MRTIVNRKKNAAISLNADDDPAVFLAFKERSSYIAGWVQGAEYILNDVRSSLEEEAGLKEEISAIEKQLRIPKKRRTVQE